MSRSPALLALLLLLLSGAAGPLPAQTSDEDDTSSGPPVLQTLTGSSAGPGDLAPSISAERITEVEKGVYRLEGYADVRYGGLRLQADRVTFHNEEKRAEAEGNVLLQQGEGTLGAARMVIDLESGEATLWDATGYTPPNYMFRAERLERIDAEHFRIYDAVFTTCNQPVPYWSFKVGEGLVHIEHYAHLKRTQFKVSKGTILYFPYLLWPVKTDRASGLLLPQFGSSKNRGFYLGNAYYWAMRRNMDATIYLDWYAKAGLAEGLEYRYVPNERGSGVLAGYMLNHDVDVAGSRRWRIGYRGEQRFGKDWRFVGTLNRVSDQDYYLDFERDLSVAVTPDEHSIADLSKTGSFYTLSFRAERRDQFFTFGTNVLQQRLPEVEFRTSSRRLGKSPFFLSVLGSANGLRREQLGLSADYRRLDAGATLSGSFSPASWFSLSPTLSLRDTYYSQRLDPTEPEGVSDEALNRPLYSVGLDMVGPTFFRIFEPPPESEGSRYKNTLEPRLVYSFISDYDQNSEIILYDEIDPVPVDVSLLTYSLTSRLLQRQLLPADDDAEADAPREYDSAREVASLELRQSVAFNRDLSVSATLDDSSAFGPVSLIGRYNPTRVTSAQLRVDYDILFKTIRSLSLSGSAQSPRYGNARLSYYLNRGLDLIPGTEVRTPDTGTIRLGGGSALVQKKFNFDLDFAYNLGTDMMQSQRYRLGYRSQCCGFTVEYLERDFGLTIPERQFRFTVTLTGVGTFLDLNSRIN